MTGTDILVDIDLDERKLEWLALRAVKNLAGRATSGPASAKVRVVRRNTTGRT